MKASRRPGRAPLRDPALKQAHEVVGLYGDPDTSWGIAVDLGVREIDPADAGNRLAGLCAVHAHLGVAPTVQVVSQEEWVARRADLAAAPYRAGALLRVAVRQDGRRLMLGAHHGAVDGLGLVAVAGVATGLPLSTLAQGVGEREPASGFLRSSLGRLREALVDPPPRFAGRGETMRSETSSTEDLSEVTRPLAERGTAHLAVAATDVFGARGHVGVPLLVVGASRRAGPLLEPDRQTAYLRMRVPVGASTDDVRRTLAAVAPEPAFPATSARGLGPWVTHLVRGRLGATALLSNLGLVEGPVESLAMFPACSGPRAVAIGLASTRACTTLSLRTRRAEFDAEEHARLLDDLADRFFAP